MTEGIIHRFRLYIVNSSPAGRRAIINFKKFSEKLTNNEIELEVVDILENPAMAESDHIIAVPALVRLSPSPVTKIIGDLSNTSGLSAFFGI
ncbi:circadian clock protein KaiB [Gammaproteobacteria bacterium]